MLSSLVYIGLTHESCGKNRMAHFSEGGKERIFSPGPALAGPGQ